LAAVLIENPVEAPGDTRATKDVPRDLKPASRGFDEADVMSELGIWLAGLESFMAACDQPFGEPAGTKNLIDAAREFSLTRSVLIKCSTLNSRLMNLRTTSGPDDDPLGNAVAGHVFQISEKEHDDLSASLRDAIVLNDSLIGAETLGYSEWRSWCNLLSQRFDALPAVRKLIRVAEMSAERYLPDKLNDLLGRGSINVEHAELSLLLPRFARILKWLSVVGKMLEADEPLKPALIIFSRVNEQIYELINYINNRLARFQDEEADLFSSLDAAAYTASIELKKVYTQELAGVATLRPATTIYARIETAHSLLTESFQQIITGFARLIDPKADVFKLFPNFQQKVEHSLILRQELWTIVKLARAAEKDPEKRPVESLNTALREFMAESIRFLFYKDTETFERFVEEIRVTKQKKDLVPILHRFGAYLETLFAQVNIRAVLEKFPFNPEKT
jgi:hypothetical protein